MSYFVAAAIAAPVTMFGIFGVLNARAHVKQLMALLRDRDTAALADSGPIPLPADSFHELRFTQSLLALSKVRSQAHDDSLEHEIDESSSLALAPRAQSKTHDRVA